MRRDTPAHLQLAPNWTASRQNARRNPLRATRFPMHSILANALADLTAGLRMHRLWIALATEDIEDQHRRTTLGPLWVLLNYLAFAATFIFVFHGGGSDPQYPTYVATGLVVWFFMMETIGSSVTLFVREESFIKGTTLPLSVYVLRATLQSTIRAGYAVIGSVIILMVTFSQVAAGWMWALPAIVIIVVIAPAAITCFAFLGVFVPDSQFLVTNLMRVGMFVTPVFWAPDAANGIRGMLYRYNPFTYFLEIVRVPLLEGHLPLGALGICLAIGALAWICALALIGRLRRQVALVL